MSLSNGLYCRRCKTGTVAKFHYKTFIYGFFDYLIFQPLGYVECIRIQLFDTLTYRITFSSRVFGSRCDSIASDENGLFGHLRG